MKILSLILILFLFSSGCTQSTDIYDNSIADLGLGFVSKQMCSCLYVVEQPKDFCLDFVKLKQINPNIEIDHEKKSVTAKVYWIFSRSSHFIDSDRGCIVD